MDGVIGTVMVCGFNFAPRNWSFCSGQLVAVNSNPSLYSLLGTNYGGDGRTTFGLPNLNGRVPVGQGQAPGGIYHWALGTIGGSDTHVMSLSELPTHSHPASFVPNSLGQSTLMASTADGESDTPREGDYLAKTVAPSGGPDKAELIYTSTSSNPVNLSGLNVPEETGSVTVGPAGQSLPFNITQPSLGVNYSICVQGIYPSRS